MTWGPKRKVCIEKAPSNYWCAGAPEVCADLNGPWEQATLHMRFYANGLLRAWLQHKPLEVIAIGNRCVHRIKFIDLYSKKG
jgi:hypothetical protein